jgi:phosphonate dehydrogenase
MLNVECEVVTNQGLDGWRREKLVEFAREAQALMTFMPDRIDSAFLSACPRLRVVAAALKGYDNIDVSACTQRGVWVTAVPDLLSPPTAELALALILGLTRNVLAGDRLVRSGKFSGWRPVLYGTGLPGKTVGVVGMGKVGQAFARLLSGFNLRMIYYDPVKMSPVQEAFLGMSRASFEEVLAQSDIVVLMLPLNESGIHLINQQALARMKPALI